MCLLRVASCLPESCVWISLACSWQKGPILYITCTKSKHSVQVIADQLYVTITATKPSGLGSYEPINANSGHVASVEVHVVLVLSRV